MRDGSGSGSGSGSDGMEHENTYLGTLLLLT